MGGFKGNFAKGGGYGTGEQGGGWDPASEVLVTKVKNIQKMPGGHDLWRAYLSRLGGGTVDPALREDWELSEFLSEVDPDGAASSSGPPKGKGKGDKGKKGKGSGDMMGDMWAMMERMTGSGAKGGKSWGGGPPVAPPVVAEALGADAHAEIVAGEGRRDGGGGGGGGGNGFEQTMSEMFEWMMSTMKGKSFDKGGKGGCDKGGCDKGGCDKGGCDKGACDKGGDKGGCKGSKDAGFSNPELDALAIRVRAIQCMDGGKELWAAYVERIGNTALRDPAQRQVSELQAFLAEADPEGNTLGALTKGKGKGKGDWWGDGGWSEWDKERLPKYVASSAEHANLIARVKAIQKKQGNEGWSVFCDKMGGYKRDPASRTVAELEAFLRESDPEGSTVGIQGEFDEVMYLTLQIKNGQRHSEQFKDLWLRFCDERANGLRDPSRHTVDTLREFMNMAPEVPNPEMDPEHNSLVDRIKQGQRSDEGFKQAWRTFCEGSGSRMMDPSRHDKAFLESFLASVGSYGKAPQLNPAASGKGGPY